MRGYKPPTVYQGAKQKIAGTILDVIQPDPDKPFWDLCCGSGAITCELLNRGFRPEQITMVDSGPWARFWLEISEGTFDLERLKSLASKAPTDRKALSYWLKGLAAGARAWDGPTFLLLQAGSFRCKAVGFDAPHSLYPCAGTFRLPGVNGDGLRPGVTEIVARVEALVTGAKGITVLQADVSRLRLPEDATVYCDPPYRGTTGYKGSLYFGCPEWKPNRAIWISESKPLGPTCFQIGTEDRTTNFRKAPNEWITLCLPSEFISRVNGAPEYTLPPSEVYEP